MTYRLTVRAFPNGEVWFFEKEIRNEYNMQKRDKSLKEFNEWRQNHEKLLST